MTKQYLLDDLILGILRENLIFRETHSKDKTIYELFKNKRITSLQINYNSPKYKEKYQALFTVCFSNSDERIIIKRDNLIKQHTVVNNAIAYFRDRQIDFDPMMFSDHITITPVDLMCSK